MKEIHEEKQKFIPKNGHHVVGVDDYAPVGEKLYLLGHHDDKAKAEAHRNEHMAKHPDATVHIYSAPGAK